MWQRPKRNIEVTNAEMEAQKAIAEAKRAEAEAQKAKVDQERERNALGGKILLLLLLAWMIWQFDGAEVSPCTSSNGIKLTLTKDGP